LKWVQCGLPRKVYAVIEKQGFKTPFPIQMQALPAIMSGRDVIACAKTVVQLDNLRLQSSN